MPKPNYSFEKRQRELAKKKKQDEKLARKQAGRATGSPDASPEQADTDADAGVAPDAPKAD